MRVFLFLSAGLAIWVATAWYVFADPLKDAALLGLDRVRCGEYVPQTDIDKNIVIGSQIYGKTFEQAQFMAAGMSIAINEMLEAQGRVADYCFSRQRQSLPASPPLPFRNKTAE